MPTNSEAKKDESEKSKKQDLQQEDSVETMVKSERKKEESDESKKHDHAKEEDSMDTAKSSNEKIAAEKSDKTPIELPESSQEADSAELRQRKMDTAKSGSEKIDTTEPREIHVELPESSNIGISSSETKARGAHVSESLRQIINWTMTGFFDFNPIYFIQLRGLTNIFHIILSVATIVLLSINCQLRPSPESRSEGFYCKPPETFLFVVSCGSFLTATLYLLCCVLSRGTDNLLFHSTFEVSYFIMYFILLLTASLTLVISELNWGNDHNILYENGYETNQVASIIGLTNSVVYGINAIWFFMSHRMHEIEEQRERESRL